MKERDELLKMAVVGFRQQVSVLSEKITAIEKELRAPGAVPKRRKPVALVGVPEAAKTRRKMSASGRARIIAAQKKRWAAVRAAKAA